MPLCAATLALLAMPAKAAVMNLALDKPAVSNSTYEGYVPALAVDGDYGTYWAAAGWASPSAPLWLEVDLGSVYLVDRVVLYGGSSGGIWDGYTKEYELYVSPDRSDWMLRGAGTLVDTADPAQQNADITFPPEDVRYVLFNGVGGSHWIGLTEMEVFGAVPEPSAYAFVLAGLSLSWAVARRAKKQ